MKNWNTFSKEKKKKKKSVFIEIFTRGKNKKVNFCVLEIKRYQRSL